MSNDVVISVSLHLSMSDGRAGVGWICVRECSDGGWWWGYRESRRNKAAAREREEERCRKEY